jgi:O-antigen ligase
MTPQRITLDTVGFLLVAVCLGIVQLTIAYSQIVFGLAAIVWLVVSFQERRRPDLPPFFLPLTIYAALTLVSAAMSSDPAASLWDSRQLLLWLMVPTVARFARGDRARTVIDVIIALGAAGAVYGIVQVTALGWGGLAKRPDGSLSHYMTYSGVLMLVTCAAVARLLFDRREWIWPAVAVPALIVALALTLSRNAWAGVFVAVGLLLALKNWKLIVLAPLVAGVGYVVAPASIKARVHSIVDSNDPTNRDRRTMMQVGSGMVRDHPLFGVGPEMVERRYVEYRPADFVNPTNPHLHNVPMQIAAERGLPALAAWLWFVGVVFRDHIREFRRGRHPAVAATGLAVMVAMLVAGLLEYNFGDSEFLMLFLGLITLPFAASRADARPSLVAPSRPAERRRA